MYSNHDEFTRAPKGGFMSSLGTALSARVSHHEAVTFARLFAALDAANLDAIDSWLSDYRSAESGAREYGLPFPTHQERC